MIEINNLGVKVGGEKILSGINLGFNVGKNYLLLGRNGSGKSSLSSFLMGNPKYKLTSGFVRIDGKDLSEIGVEDRAKLGLFMSFQNVPEILGVNLGEYLRIIYNNALKVKSPGTMSLSPFVFKRFVKPHLKELNIDENFLERDLNVGFSGGEKRKIEILQAKLLEPKYIILDEIDSGLDVDAFKAVSELVAKLNNENNTIIIITHHFKITEYLNFDKVFVLKDGKIDKEGGVDLIADIQEKGFE